MAVLFPSDNKGAMMAISRMGGYLVAAVSAAALFAGTACDNATTEKPYQPVTISDLVNDTHFKNQFVSVEGLPGKCGDLKLGSDTNAQFCLLAEGENTIYLKRTSSKSLNSDYKAARQAFEAEANDGDSDKVRAFGRYRGDNLLQTEYFLIDGVLYSVKE